ncbi:DUF3024 domain-containing protein [Flavobacterium selenitireducens]|uniref:DUF3024 domain-containing protein n=1 Tax=Flavobacterium selenitireducens TaxID=2722704 RepID=UPI00168AFBEE|nr:DUF3024 domain-containing protein [Flavobacterium selenitireducens]MBD3584042.1 DUF3024 domain-containing protein [Flavobacterium selenitireducens]
MALEFENEIEIIEVMESYLISARPREEIRSQLDIGYKVDGQNVIIFEIRPSWTNPKEKAEYYVAKAAFVKKENTWKIFWLMSDLKWHNYKPLPRVKSLKEFVDVVKEDKLGCFWG